MYKGCAQLIEKTISYNSSLHDHGDTLITLIQNGVKGIDQNLTDLKKLIPKTKRSSSRGKSAEQKYFANKQNA